MARALARKREGTVCFACDSVSASMIAHREFTPEQIRLLASIVRLTLTIGQYFNQLAKLTFQSTNRCVGCVHAARCVYNIFSNMFRAFSIPFSA